MEWTGDDPQGFPETSAEAARAARIHGALFPGGNLADFIGPLLLTRAR